MSIMKFEDFVDKLRKALAAYYGTEFSVGVNKVRKNNGMVLTGITIRKRDENVAPTFYAEGFYNQYKAKSDFGTVFMDVVRLISSAKVPNAFDISFFTEYSKVKNNINIKLVNKEKNSELLTEVPYVDFLDMAAIFYYAFDDEMLKNGSILIRNEHLKVWGVSKGELYENALKNTDMSYKPVVENIVEIMGRILAQKRGVSEDNMDELLSEIPGEDKMYVMSSNGNLYGATALLFNEHFKSFADTINDDLYIIPSSIHELILVPADMNINIEYLQNMVRSVNDNEVAEDEILSYSIYYYNRRLNQIDIIRANVA